MRISYSRYSTFVANPERYRLSYELGLVPEGDDTPSRMNLGRRRGSCFHEMYEGVPRKELLHKWGAELVKRCDELRTVVPDLGPLSLVEEAFEVPILDGKHSIIGRIDHGFFASEQFRIGDFKTTKGNRTKKEEAEYLGKLYTSPQHHFYLKASASMGHPTELFTYHVVFDKKDKDHAPRYYALDIPPTGAAAVERTMREVYAAAEAIEAMRAYGVEKPWAHANAWPCCGDRMFCGFANLCGRTIPKGAIPDGFTAKYKEVIQAEADAV